MENQAPTVNRPTFNPIYFEIGRAFKIKTVRDLSAMDYKFNQGMKFRRINVLVKDIQDRGETLIVVGILKYDGSYKPIEVIVKIEEADFVEWVPLVEVQRNE